MDIIETVTKNILPHIQSHNDKSSKTLWRILGQNRLIGTASTDSLATFFEIAEALLISRNVGIMASFAINEIVYQLIHSTDSEKYGELLKQARNGDVMLALALSEESGGSDISKMNTTYKRISGGYILDGKKSLISNGPLADCVVVAARPEAGFRNLWSSISLLLVTNDQEGYTAKPYAHSYSAAGLPFGEIILQNCLVQEENNLGKEGRGFFALNKILAFERLVVGKLAISVAKLLLRDTIEYCNSREVFGSKLTEFQTVRTTLGRYEAQLLAVNSLFNKIVDDYNNGTTEEDEIIACKVLTTELLRNIADACGQIMGGKIYREESWLSNIYNDSRWLSIAGGANEMLIDIFSKRAVRIK